MAWQSANKVGAGLNRLAEGIDGSGILEGVRTTIQRRHYHAGREIKALFDQQATGYDTQ